MDDVEWTRQAFEQGKDLNFVVTEFVKKGYDEQQIDSIISKAREASKPQSSITPELVTPTPVVVLPETQNPIASAKQKPIKKYLIIAVILIIFIAAGYFFFFYMPQAAAIEESVKVADKFKNTTNGNLDESILKMKYFKGEIDELPEGVYECTSLEGCQLSLDVSNESNVVISWWADKILENPQEYNLDAVLGLSFTSTLQAISILQLTGIYLDTRTDFAEISSNFYPLALESIDNFNRDIFITKMLNESLLNEEDAKLYNRNYVEKSADLYEEFLQFEKQRMQQLNSEEKYAALFIHESSLIVGCSYYCDEINSYDYDEIKQMINETYVCNSDNDCSLNEVCHQNICLTLKEATLQIGQEIITDCNSKFKFNETRNQLPVLYTIIDEGEKTSAVNVDKGDILEEIKEQKYYEEGVWYYIEILSATEYEITFKYSCKG